MNLLVATHLNAIRTLCREYGVGRLELVGSAAPHGGRTWGACSTRSCRAASTGNPDGESKRQPTPSFCQIAVTHRLLV